jgi:hypothetical protein
MEIAKHHTVVALECNTHFSSTFQNTHCMMWYGVVCGDDNVMIVMVIDYGG